MASVVIPAETRSERAAGDEGRREPQHQSSFGANIVDGGSQFRVWAPLASRVDVAIGDVLFPMVRDGAETWYAFVPGIDAGVRYRYRIDDHGLFPDPYSRSQPEGPHGPSEIVDPGAFRWHDDGWPGLRADELVIYECHVGCYTPDGTFDALIGELDALARLGITAVELMPIADFPGGRNWGYDGVNLFAPSRNYGGPQALRRLVDAAHEHGIGVILDVVYNHFGPDGNYLLQYSPDYLTDRYATPWGDAVNYDGPRSAMVRRLVVDNAGHWLREYHIDGLRLDATFAIFDHSQRHILEEIATAARASVDRNVVLIAETHENDAGYLRPASAGGFGFDAVWVDDFHHAVHTAASHEDSGYYADYDGTLAQLARTIRRGWLFEGQPSKRTGEPRGTPSDGIAARSFIYCIQNHDQIGNRAFGRRLSHLIGPGVDRAWAALLLLLPYTPMLFMGQEFAASSRFYFFSDHEPSLGRRITEGRRREVAGPAGLDNQRQQREIPDPQSEQTFLDSRLDLRERDEGIGQQTFAMYAELIALRRSDPVLRRQDRERMRVDVAGDLLLVHTWNGREHRLLAANTGMGIDAAPGTLHVPHSLTGRDWAVITSTDDRRFGGTGGQVRFDHRLVSMPPHTVAWLASTDRALPMRALRAALRLVTRRR